MNYVSGLLTSHFMAELGLRRRSGAAIYLLKNQKNFPILSISARCILEVQW